jgi:hypothetical protein
MIRKEVENLRGLVLTPEELEDVILPLVATAKERKNKPEHDSPITRELLEQSYKKYLLWSKECEKAAKAYGILSDMAKNNPNSLLYLWDKILETGRLVCPGDIDEELLLALDVGRRIDVYGDCYEVSDITGRNCEEVHFRKL